MKVFRAWLGVSLTSMIACTGDHRASTETADEPGEVADAGLQVEAGSGAPGGDAGTDQTGSAFSDARVDAGNGETVAADSGVADTAANVDGSKQTDSGASDAGAQSSACDAMAQASGAPKVLIVLDRSSSMVNTVPTRWELAVRAIEAFTVEHAQTIQFGLIVFPAPSELPGGFDPNILVDPNVPIDPNTWIDPNTYLTLSCEPGKLDVPPALNTAGQIAATLATSMPDIGATPMAAALEAALAYFINASACPDCATQKKYVLLLTDGAPTCGAGGTVTTPEDIEQVNVVLDNAIAADVKTYVVGFANEADPAADAAMEEFARRGGTDHPYLVDDAATLAQELMRIGGRMGC